MNKTIKILSFNTHKFYTPVLRKLYLEKFHEKLKQDNYDLVFLQEFQELTTTQSNEVQQSRLEKFADSLWPHNAYGQNALYPKGHHGNLILSRFAIEHWKNLDISNHKLERRGILHAVVHPIGENRPLHLICTHFDLTAWGRKKQTDKLLSLLQSLPSQEPLVVCGDFNDWDGFIAKKLLECGLTDPFQEMGEPKGYTFPWFKPFMALDGVFLKNLKVERAHIPEDLEWRRFSDHLPIAITVSI